MTNTSEITRRTRLLFKKEFIRYYRALCSRSIADPTDAHLSLEGFLSARQHDLGQPLFAWRKEEELSALLGEIAQDLTAGRQRESLDDWRSESLEERFWECVQVVEKRSLRIRGL